MEPPDRADEDQAEKDKDAEKEKDGSKKTKTKALRRKSILLDNDRLLKSAYGVSKLKAMVSRVKFKQGKGNEVRVGGR